MSDSPEEIWSTRDAAHHLSRSVITLNRWRKNGEGPEYYRVNGRIYYSPSDVRTWLEAHKVAR